MTDDNPVRLTYSTVHLNRHSRPCHAGLVVDLQYIQSVDVLFIADTTATF